MTICIFTIAVLLSQYTRIDVHLVHASAQPHFVYPILGITLISSLTANVLPAHSLMEVVLRVVLGFRSMLEASTLQVKMDYIPWSP
jgi:hypothetical protein